METETSPWITLIYERNKYVINLSSISSFCASPNGRLTFWLPGSSIPIILSSQTEPEAYNRVIEFIKKHTGQSL